MTATNIPFERGAGSDSGEPTAERAGRGKPDAAAKAVSAAEVATPPATGLSEERRGDQRILEGDDGHLDPDRLFDPGDYDPYSGTPSGQSANRGHVVLELYLGADDRPTCRVVDERFLDELSEAVGRRNAEGRLRQLRALGRVLAARNADAVVAPDAHRGRACIVPMTQTELAAHKLAGDAFSSGRGAERSLLSRIQDDLVSFPWGTVDLGFLLSANKGGSSATTPSSADPARMSRAWDRWLVARRSGTKSEHQRVVAGALGCADDTAKRYRLDFELIFEWFDELSGLAVSAVDLNDFRTWAEAIMGRALRREALYQPLFAGLFSDPALCLVQSSNA